MFEEEDQAEAIPTSDAAPQEAASPGVETFGAEPAQEQAQEQASLAPTEEAIPTSQVPMPKPRKGPPGTIQTMVDIANEGGTGEQGPVKRIISYLLGNDAAPPQMVAQSAAMVDPDNRMSPSQRNLLAIERASTEGGPEAGWKMLQAHRVSFNAKQAFAEAALRGNQQKPPDLRAAVDAANQAQAHILDGSDVVFAATPRGVTATVTGADGQPEQIQLSPDAFRRYLNVGGDGQFDKLMRPGGVPAALRTLAAGGMGGQRPMQGVAHPQQVDVPRGEPQQPQSNSVKKQDRVDTGETQRLRRAHEIYPWASQSSDRARFLAAQEDRDAERESRVNVAREQGRSRVDAADVRGQHATAAQGLKNEGSIGVAKVRNEGWMYASDAKRQAAEARIKADIQKMEANNANQAQSRSLRVVLEKIRTMQDLTPDEQRVATTYLQDTPGAAAVTRPQSQTSATPPQQPAKGNTPGQAPEPGAKFYKGQWYRRGPNGEAQLIQ